MLSSSPSPAAPSVKVFEQIVRKRGRECPRCGGRHRDTVYKMCQPCRDLTAAIHQAWRLDHKARKLCTECIQKKGSRGIRCDYHLDYDNELHQRIYADQRAKGLCGFGRCKTESESSLCEVHAELKRAYCAKSRTTPRPRARNRRWAA